jgi:hypothetical protein
MSLLDGQNSIHIKVYYKYVDSENGKKLVILEDEKAKELLKNKEKEKGIEILEILETTWSQLNWKQQNEITTVSSKPVDVQTGDVSFDFVSYRDAIVKKCLKTWNIVVNEKPVPVTAENIDQLPSIIVTSLYQKFDQIITYSEEEAGN